MSNTNLSEKIYQASLSCGFDNCGIIPLEYMDGFKKFFQERMRKVPSNAPFLKMLDGLAETKKRFPWAKSIVICTFWYGKYRYPQELQGRYAKDFFLWPEDHPQKGFDHLRFEKWFSKQGIRWEGGSQFGHVSVGSLRYAAMMAGMGIIRKNNFFYTENGSYTLLMGYVIDQECEMIHHSELKPCSESCDLCRKACKTKALKEPYTFNALNCVSFWTTFGKGIVPPYLKKDMFEEWICGCDNCQDACPYNRKHDWSEGEVFSDLEELAAELLPEKVLEQSDDYLIEHVISKTADHLKPSDVSVLRRNAKRALRFRDKL